MNAKFALIRTFSPSVLEHVLAQISAHAGLDHIHRNAYPKRIPKGIHTVDVDNNLESHHLACQCAAQPEGNAFRLHVIQMVGHVNVHQEVPPKRNHTQVCK